MLRGKREAEEASAKASKYQKTIDDGAEEFVCPITQELPLDPVMAEDGRVYERSAITDWLRTKKKSPHTNESMGSKLIPAMQVKNLISSMVRSGAISGDKAGAWTKKLEAEKNVEETRRLAEAGDKVKMTEMGRIYRDGTHGMSKDDSLCVQWFKRAAGLDYPPAINNLGKMYLKCPAGLYQPAHGLMLISQAAAMGVDHACYSLADKYSRGLPAARLAKDLERAQYWAKKTLDEDHVRFKCMSNPSEFIEKCRRWAEGNFEE
jgi:hypothetical protein